MATTQYIGARYVPKFFENSGGTSEWTANTAYEPLTIVTRNGNSYTSKKTVPASVGAPEDNADYWVSTGIYNQQVEQYRQEVEQLSADVAEMATAELEENTFKNVPMLLMGNSWAAGAGGIIGRGFTYYMQQFSQCDADFIQIRGGDFVHVGNAQADYPNYTALGALNLWAQTKTTERLNSIKYVVYGGGLNDAFADNNTYTAEYAAVDTWIKRAKELMPNARIIIIPCCGLGLMPNTFHARCYQAMFDAAVDNGEVSNPYYVTWFYGRMNYKTAENNENHLNDAGYQLLAHYILSFMRGWNGNLIKNISSVTGVKNPDGDYSNVHLYNDGNLVNLSGQFNYIGTTYGKLTDGDIIATITNADMRPMQTTMIPAFIYADAIANRKPVWLQIRNTGDIVFRAIDADTNWSTNCNIFVNATYNILNR